MFADLEGSIPSDERLFELFDLRCLVGHGLKVGIFQSVILLGKLHEFVITGRSLHVNDVGHHLVSTVIIRWPATGGDWNGLGFELLTGSVAI